MTTSLRRMRDLWFPHHHVTEITDPLRARALLASKASATWGTGPLIDHSNNHASSGWHQLAIHSPSRPGEDPTVLICKTDLLLPRYLGRLDPNLIHQGELTATPEDTFICTGIGPTCGWHAYAYRPGCRPEQPEGWVDFFPLHHGLHSDCEQAAILHIHHLED